MPARSSVTIDCSLLAHALIPSQQTREAEEALERLIAERRRMVAAPALYLEFSGLLLKFRNQGKLSDEFATMLFYAVMDLRVELEPMSLLLMRRAWSIAFDLRQSDAFDAIGLAAAEFRDAEFWTSDRRFANAAANRVLDRVVYIR